MANGDTKKPIKGIIEDKSADIFIPTDDMSECTKLKIKDAINTDTESKKRLTSYDVLEFNKQFNRFVLSPKKLFHLEKRDGKEGFVAPIGLIGNVDKLLSKEADMKLEVKDNRKDQAKMPFKPNFDPRKYQEPIIKSAIEDKNGLIIMGTGSGKTIVAGHIIGNLGQDTVFFVPNNTLLLSTTDDIRKDVVPKKPDGTPDPSIHVGQIGGGIVNFQDHPDELDINVVSLPMAVRVFNKRNVNPKVKQAIEKATNMSNIVIVDEAHVVGSEGVKNVIHSSPAKYRFGLTATPYTKNELDLTSTFGDEISNLKAKKLVDIGELVKPEIYRIDNSDITPKNDDELLGVLQSNYCKIPPKSGMYKQVFGTKAIPNKKNKFRVQYVRKGLLECNPKRNERIGDVIERLNDNNKTTLVFVTSDEHGRKLISELKTRNVDATLFTGQSEEEIVLTPDEMEDVKKECAKNPKIKQSTCIKNTKKRQFLFDRVKKGKVKVLISTPKLLGAGVSIKGIDSIVYADVGQSKVDAVQTVGRAMRTDKAKGKKEALVFDFMNEEYPDAEYMDKWGEQRKQAWQDEEYSIMNIKPEDLDKVIPKKKK